VSTTFEVYPGTDHIPTFAAVLGLGTRYLHEYLTDHSIAARPTIAATLHRPGPGESDRVTPVAPDAPFRWDKGEYAWLTARPAPGGTDASFDRLDQGMREGYEKGLGNGYGSDRWRAMVRAHLTRGYSWYFRRSMGQPAIISIAYGFLAAALADLTAGSIHAEDGAWDAARFPATAAEFRTWYFRPDQALREDNRVWAERCIGHLREELGGGSGRARRGVDPQG